MESSREDPRIASDQDDEPNQSVTPPPGRDWRLFNVIILGLAFMFMFTAFQTCGMVEQSVLDTVKKESNGTFNADGYTSLSIIYAVFAGANWIAPSVVAVCGPKISMFLGGLTYNLYIFSFLKPMTWALYTGSVLIGIGAAVIWTAQGNFLTINSDPSTIGRNSGIFWALLQCSLLFGNLFVFFEFKGDKEIEPSKRMILFIVLSVTCMIGLLLLIPLRRKPLTGSRALNVNVSRRDSQETKPDGPVQAFVKAVKLLATRDMLLLSVASAYTGFELTFFSGVYGTSVGHTGVFSTEAKSLLGLCGIFIGVGEILGGGLFGLLGTRTSRYGRDPIVLLGFIVHMASFYLIFLNLPPDSPYQDQTRLPTYIPANKYVAVLCAFLMGLGDSSFNTQLFSILGDIYSDNSVAAFAIFKFVQSLAAAAGFFYSQHLLLQYQLLILVVSGFAGTLCFFIVEWTGKRPQRDGYMQI